MWASGCLSVSDTTAAVHVHGGMAVRSAKVQPKILALTILCMSTFIESTRSCRSLYCSVITQNEIDNLDWDLIAPEMKPGTV